MSEALPRHDAPVVQLRRVFRAPRAKVFRAWTEPRAVERWFGPHGWSTRVVRLDVRVDGEYEFAMTPPTSGAPHRLLGGRFREIVPDRRLVFTWTWKDDDQPQESRVTIDFNDAEGGTEIVLQHERLATAEAREGHTGGWTESLDRLGESLS